jgi:sporulation protein YlmC with PRC-barrel domain
VTVQQQQPQVTVQREGQPQVNVQREGQPQATTGATATPAPAQSGSANTQAAVAGAAMGVPLARVSELVGKNVLGADGQDAGEIRNLLIDRAGNVRGAVVEWGGFLGIGERQAVVPIERIQLATGTNERARLSMTREQLEALPRYDRNNLNEASGRYGWGDGVRLYR